MFAIVVAITALPSVCAGGQPDLNFKSGFEFIESCMEFDGLGDSISIPTITVSGDFLHNGVAMSSDDDRNGEFYLETAAGDRAFLGNSDNETFERNIIPGTDDLFWEKEVPGDDVPFNPRARIATGVVVAAGNVPVNMNSHIMSGNLTLNSFAFPASNLETGRILAVDSTTGASTVVRQTHFGAYNRRMADANRRPPRTHALFRELLC